MENEKVLCRMSGARGFVNDSHANVTIIFALAMLPLFGAVGAGLDYARANAAKAAMQGALDAALIAAAKDSKGKTAGQIVATAKALFPANLNNADISNIQMSATYDSASLKLAGQASGAVSAKMINFLSLQTLPVSVASEVRSASAGACVIALDTSAQGAFSTTGSGDISIPNCGMQVNSSHPNAIKQNGASTILANSIKVVGGYSGGNYSPTPQTKQATVEDPLANIPEPSAPGACNYSNVSFTVDVTLPAGSVYCGNISFSANLIFSSGIHYFKNANVSIGSGANLLGTQVMLYFDGSSNLDQSVGNGTVTISPPDSGTYVGIAIFGSRTASSMKTFSFRGNGGYFISGAIYLPKGKLAFTGSSNLAVTGKSGYVIARQFSYTGDSTFTMDTFGGSGPSALNKMVLLTK